MSSHIQLTIQENTEIPNRVHRNDAAVWIKSKIVIVQRMSWVDVSMEPNEFSFDGLSLRRIEAESVLNFVYTGDKFIFRML